MGGMFHETPSTRRSTVFFTEGVRNSRSQLGEPLLADASSLMLSDPSKEKPMAKWILWAMVPIAAVQLATGAVEKVLFARMSAVLPHGALLVHTHLAALNALLYSLLRVARSQSSASPLPERLRHVKLIHVAIMGVLDAIHSLFVIDAAERLRGITQATLLQSALPFNVLALAVTVCIARRAGRGRNGVSLVRIVAALVAASAIFVSFFMEPSADLQIALPHAYPSVGEELNEARENRAKGWWPDFGATGSHNPQSASLWQEGAVPRLLSSGAVARSEMKPTWRPVPSEHPLSSLLGHPSVEAGASQRVGWRWLEGVPLQADHSRSSDDDPSPQVTSARLSSGTMHRVRSGDLRDGSRIWQLANRSLLVLQTSPMVCGGAGGRPGGDAVHANARRLREGATSALVLACVHLRGASIRRVLEATTQVVAGLRVEIISQLRPAGAPPEVAGSRAESAYAAHDGSGGAVGEGHSMGNHETIGDATDCTLHLVLWDKPWLNSLRLETADLMCPVAQAAAAASEALLETALLSAPMEISGASAHGFARGGDDSERRQFMATEGTHEGTAPVPGAWVHGGVAREGSSGGSTLADFDVLSQQQQQQGNGQQEQHQSSGDGTSSYGGDGGDETWEPHMSPDIHTPRLSSDPLASRLLFVGGVGSSVVSSSLKSHWLKEAPVDVLVLNSYVPLAQLAAGLVVGPVLLLVAHGQPIDVTFRNLGRSFYCYISTLIDAIVSNPDENDKTDAGATGMSPSDRPAGGHSDKPSGDVKEPPNESQHLAAALGHGKEGDAGYSRTKAGGPGRSSDMEASVSGSRLPVPERRSAGSGVATSGTASSGASESSKGQRWSCACEETHLLPLILFFFIVSSIWSALSFVLLRWGRPVHLHITSTLLFPATILGFTAPIRRVFWPLLAPPEPFQLPQTAVAAILFVALTAYHLVSSNCRSASSPSMDSDTWTSKASSPLADADEATGASSSEISRSATADTPEFGSQALSTAVPAHDAAASGASTTRAWEPLLSSTSSMPDAAAFVEGGAFKLKPNSSSSAADVQYSAASEMQQIQDLPTQGSGFGVSQASSRDWRDRDRAAEHRGHSGSPEGTSHSGARVRVPSPLAENSEGRRSWPVEGDSIFTFQ